MRLLSLEPKESEYRGALIPGSPFAQNPRLSGCVLPPIAVCRVPPAECPFNKSTSLSTRCGPMYATRRYWIGHAPGDSRSIPQNSH